MPHIQPPITVKLRQPNLLGLFIGSVLLIVLLALFGVASAHSGHESSCNKHNFYCAAQKLSVGTNALKNVSAVKVEVPAPPRAARVVTYVVETKGAITTSLAEFKTQANQTLNDTRSWSRLGVSFEEVASGGQFTLVLSEASQVPSFSPGCSSEYSCNAGRYVIINQDRWLGATEPWNAAGGSLRDYRHMVVNHETGHWLGHGHRACPGAGLPAPVMQQQSIDLQGCAFNPWPIESELHSTRLGI